MSLICKNLMEDIDLFPILRNYYDGNFFCSEEWSKFIVNAYGAKRNYIGIFDSKSLVGFFPAYTLKKGPLKIIGSPLRGWFTPWLGPRFFDSSLTGSEINLLSDQSMSAFDNYVSTNKFDYVECSSMSVSDEIMTELNYDPLKKATVILDISRDLDDLLQSFGKTCRKRIRKAESFGCEVRDISNVDFIDVLWDMTIDVFGRRGSGPVHDKRIIKSMINQYLPTGDVLCLGVYREKELLAIGVHLRKKNYLYDLFRATFVRNYEYFPYHILYWELFKRAKMMGCECFDMMGVDPNNPDLFKLSFKPSMIEWNHWSKSRTFTAKISRSLYENYINKVKRNISRFGLKNG